MGGKCCPQERSAPTGHFGDKAAALCFVEKPNALRRLRGSGQFHLGHWWHWPGCPSHRHQEASWTLTWNRWRYVLRSMILTTAILSRERAFVEAHSDIGLDESSLCCFGYISSPGNTSVVVSFETAWVQMNQARRSTADATPQGSVQCVAGRTSSPSAHSSQASSHFGWMARPLPSFALNAFRH